uniref:RRM domain-containing protein n=1 Tax=Globodera rostochiensis TaxID=31243 RepID=A0A914HFF7_GLORO
MSSNARRSDSDSDKSRRRPPKSVRRSADERNEQPVPLNPYPLQQLLLPQSQQHHHSLPQPLMAQRRVAPPGMAVNFSGQAFSDTELLGDIPRKKFTGRCRLFVGNLPIEVKEAELKELFTPHGDIAECFLSGKGFAFLRLDTRAHAESAKEALDGKNIHGRPIRVRYAVHGATIRVKELSPAVSNEMLHLAFCAFGDVERAVHIVDEKGKPTGEGIVEFERKVSAQEAIAQIRERVFLMTVNSRPLYAEFVEPRDEEDGLSEKMIQRTHHLLKERELGPRFASMNSFEYMYGRRWKDLYEFERKRRAEVEAELREQRRRLDADMEVEYEDYKAQLLREELQRRQEELERLEASRQMRRQQMQQQQLMGAGMMLSGWEPQMVDGPLGRNMPPTFGQGAPMSRGMPGMHSHPPSLIGMGPSAHRGGGGGGGDDEDRKPFPGLGSGGGGMQQNGRGQSPQGPDVRKMLQGFRDSPQQQQQQGRMQGPLPPGLASLLDRVPLQQQQQQHHHQQHQQMVPSPFGAFFSPGIGTGTNGGGGGGGPPPPGGRIPPPPSSSMGGGVPQHMLQQQAPVSLMSMGDGGGDFVPDNKKARH